jgi:hypothetical protein
MTLACICRKIDAASFTTEEALRERIMRGDIKCGQCQLRYMSGFDAWSPKSHPDTEHQQKA